MTGGHERGLDLHAFLAQTLKDQEGRARLDLRGEAVHAGAFHRQEHRTDVVVPRKLSIATPTTTSRSAT
jgi:hypothetical protein